MLCDNNSSQGNGVVSPRCYKNRATRRIIITYSPTAGEFSEQDILYLCNACSLTLVQDAKKQGYDVQFDNTWEGQ